MGVQAIQGYFSRYGQQGAGAAPSAEKPPPPVYTAPIHKTAVVKACAFDAILYGVSLAVIYSITAFCIRKISGSMNPPPLPKHSWKAIGLLLPFFAYRVVQVIVGFFVHPAANLPVKRFVDGDLEEMRKNVPEGYQAMRISARSSTGHLVDGVFLKKEGVDLQGRCMIVTPPNAAFYEQMMAPNSSMTDLATHLKANILFFNYAGAGRSSGWFPNRDAMVASHQVMRSLLEEMGAAQIVDFGWSIGGGVKWRDHLVNPSPKGKCYVIDYQTFRSLSNFGWEIFGEFGRKSVKFLQWEYDSEKALKQSPHPYFVVQTLGDRLMKKGNTLAEVADRNCACYNIGGHGSPLTLELMGVIAEKVEAFFLSENKAPLLIAEPAADNDDEVYDLPDSSAPKCDNH